VVGVGRAAPNTTQIDQDHSDIESALWAAGLAIGVTEVVGWLGTLYSAGRVTLTHDWRQMLAKCSRVSDTAASHGKS
jgi:hypothetical protein